MSDLGRGALTRGTSVLAALVVVAILGAIIVAFGVMNPLQEQSRTAESLPGQAAAAASALAINSPHVDTLSQVAAEEIIDVGCKTI